MNDTTMMFDYFFTLAKPWQIDTYLLSIVIALLCGLVAALASSVRSRSSKSFFITVVLLAPIVETVILLVNGNIGTGIAVAGAFSLVRFRSAPGKAQEIMTIFMSMTAGLACAGGYLGVALLFTAVISACMVVMLLFPRFRRSECVLRITVPETLNYTDAFTDIFEKYMLSCRRTRVKTTNLGSLYELQFKFVMKNPAQVREMIDEIRCRNGNLEISVNEDSEREEEL